MSAGAAQHPFASALSPGQVAVAGVVAVAAFHLAYAFTACSVLMGLYLFCVLQLARARTTRGAFYPGLAVGLGVYVPQADFLWNIFNVGAFSLWMVLAFWVALFVALARMCWARYGPAATALAAPFLWTGLEYFRSELYPLRFAWITPGYAFSPTPAVGAVAGVYGTGFLLMTLVAVIWLVPRRLVALGVSLLLAGVGAFVHLHPYAGDAAPPAGATIRVAGVQMEPALEELQVARLDEVLRKHPAAELVLMSEYCFQTPPPEPIRAWCRRNKRFLVAGGKEPIDGKRFYNTAFVVGPSGDVVFRQPKCRPVQFFRDGMPAPDQNVWDSPWGKIGLCICYDLGYRRVMDRLTQLGAQAILVPTLDELDWGRREHEHHARVARVRAAELGVPIFRVGIAGIPQLVDATGRTVATAAFPGQDVILGGELQLGRPARLPLDHWLAPLSVGATGALWAWLGLLAWRGHRAPNAQHGLAVPLRNESPA
jgi:apolipoprotein N-acyltransferase